MVWKVKGSLVNLTLVRRRDDDRCMLNVEHRPVTLLSTLDRHFPYY